MQKGKLSWHVACDESGVGGQKFYGFGSLWMKYQRRGDFVVPHGDVGGMGKELMYIFENTKTRLAGEGNSTVPGHGIIVIRDGFF